MTTIYAQYLHKNAIKEVHMTSDHPKIALQNFISQKGYSNDTKDIEQFDSGYKIRIGGMNYLAY